MKIVWFVLEAVAAAVWVVLTALDLVLKNQAELNRYRPIDEKNGYDE